MLKKYLLVALFFLVSCGGSKQNSLDFTQIQMDSLFDSKQSISLLALPYESFYKFNIEVGYSQSELIKTSLFGKNKNAIAAINGSFFDMDKGGSVTYLEINDLVISQTRNPSLKWGVSDSRSNGAIVVTNNSEITIENANSDQFYEQSKQESMVLVSGPLLLLDSEIMELPSNEFTNKRHPRTILCLSEESIIFITIDGRQQDAEGMSLAEVQTFLLNRGCIDAINLDGGGSTTMWINEKGIVNSPSDQSGERPVANAIVVIRKP